MSAVTLKPSCFLSQCIQQRERKSSISRLESATLLDSTMIMSPHTFEMCLVSPLKVYEKVLFKKNNEINSFGTGDPSPKKEYLLN